MNLDKVAVLIEAMNREQVDYALFGALALGVHGLVRATEDADFFLRPTVENVERLKRALRAVWDDPNIEEISAEELTGDYPSVVYYPAGEDFGIDFLTRLGEAFAFDSLEVQDGVLDGIPVRVVSPATLYAMKRDTVRYKDRIDAEALRNRFFPEE
jgi:hypothetical protein